MSREVATLSGSYHPYAKRRVDWRAVFEELSRDSPHRTVKEVATERGLPYETVRSRWKKYQLGVKKEDPTLVAIACGDVDGRRDNHRIFTREEETLVRTAIDQENVDPNKPVIQRLALSIHRQHQHTSTPANNTRSHPHADVTSCASDRFVERIKRDFGLSSQKTRVLKKDVRKKDRSGKRRS